MLLVDIQKFGDRNAHLIWTIDEVCFLQFGLVRQAFVLLVFANGVVDGVGNLREGFLLSGVDELFLLEFNAAGAVHFTLS